MIQKYLFSGILLLLISITGFSQHANSGNTTKPDTTITKPAPVVFMNDTLFVLTEYLGAFSPEERAEAIKNRLESISEDYTDVKDSFNIIKANQTYLIKFKESSIMSVTNQDAKAIGIPASQLAERYRHKIQKVFFQDVEVQSQQSLIMKIIFTTLTLIGLFLIFYLIIRFFKWADAKIVAYENKINRKRKSVFRYLMPKGKQDVFLLITSVIRYFLYFLVLVLYLPLLFRYIPWSKGIVNEFYGYLTTPVNYIFQSFLSFLPDLFFILIIFFTARYIVRVLTTIEEEYEKDKIRIKGFHKDWAKPTLNILKVVIYAFALIFMFPYIPGSNSAAFKGVSIFFGVLLSLGSTSAISNIVAGIVITYMRPFMMGDRVKIGETIGDVVEKSMLVTKIRTLKNEDVTIPNATIINTHLWNFSKNAKDLGIILYTSITIGYNVSWETVNKLLIKAARQTKLLQRTPPPFVLQKNLDNYSVEYELNVYTKQAAKMQDIYSELRKNILDVFNEAKVEILSPKYVASRDGNHSTIPSEKEPKPAANPVDEIIDQVTGKNQKPIKTSRSNDLNEEADSGSKKSDKSKPAGKTKKPTADSKPKRPKNKKE
jgi:small-conductance mechanosensitive channel